jgi:hypothetical protein
VPLPQVPQDIAKGPAEALAAKELRPPESAGGDKLRLAGLTLRRRSGCMKGVPSWALGNIDGHALSRESVARRPGVGRRPTTREAPLSG